MSLLIGPLADQDVDVDLKKLESAQMCQPNVKLRQLSRGFWLFWLSFWLTDGGLMTEMACLMAVG
ncbi:MULTISPECIES: hypothetical protein [unclassified Mesorhizobium]|uniref:hypothetical protein n=1 Tax=unclassified Mesorhizobium TaxID=325217 RepID=UPI001126871E|nr:MULTISPECIES: hypothetical protein [unclassified Mesorhizobium]TPJ49538.1 hypothetical protein FJ437_04740 [Mesorhizobium sp. B2-6-6]TPM58771.1 hypothetical protein FJ962_20015 [Mesorhizobium sp. B2-1-9]MCA0020480.1 hypothetical protein [Mesorhizobium sp. B264B1A]TPK63435.1 hypothetical protein FJ551_15375 [Mesorhizobium sp. B2-5-1]TPN09567.1 hypothetical protein FJ971_17180 [Mesorhizobium sp. B2-1-2]